MPAVPTHELRFAHLPTGARIAWARSGRPRGPVLVRTGHWMTHAEQDLRSPLWAPWIERLGRRFTLVRYDERGCGLSTDDGVPPSLAASVEELGAVIEAQGPSPVVLFGVSAGACAAIAYAVAQPRRVSHLVLLGGYTHGLYHRGLSPESLAFHEAQVRLVESGWGRNMPAVQEFFSAHFLPDGPMEARAALNEQQRLSCDGQRAASLMRARAGADVRDLAPQLRVPTLVLHAQGDRVVPFDCGRGLAAAIPGARLVALPTANHLPVAPEPAFEQLCAAVEAFAAQPVGAPQLTPAERALAGLVGEGRDNLQIAAALGLAEKTVRNRLSALYAKLGVEGRPQAVVRVRDLGL